MISMNHYSYPHDHEMKHSNIDHLIHLEMKQENIMGSSSSSSGAGGQHHLHHHLHPIHHQVGHMIDHDPSSLIYFNQNRPPIYQSQQELQTQLNNNTNNEQSSIKLSNETEYNQYNNTNNNKSDSLNRVLSMSDSINTFETKLNHLGVENQFSDDDDDDDDENSSSSSSNSSTNNSSISSRQSCKNITDNKSSGNNQTVLNNNNYNSETVNTNSNKKIEETTDNNNKSSSPVEKLKMKSDQHIDMKSCVSDVCEEVKMNPVNQTQSSPNSKQTADSDEAVSVYKKFKMNDTQILNMNAKTAKQQTEQSEMDTEKNNDSIEMSST
jgi:hypothetical protein